MGEAFLFISSIYANGVERIYLARLWLDVLIDKAGVVSLVLHVK